MSCKRDSLVENSGQLTTRQRILPHAARIPCSLFSCLASEMDSEPLVVQPRRREAMVSARVRPPFVSFDDEAVAQQEAVAAHKHREDAHARASRITSGLHALAPPASLGPQGAGVTQLTTLEISPAAGHSREQMRASNSAAILGQRQAPPLPEPVNIRGDPNMIVLYTDRDAYIQDRNGAMAMTRQR